MKLLPCWHGTGDAAASGIIKTGFAALQSTDAGWFGKGMYFAVEAQYSYEHYAVKQKGQVLLFCWASCFSAYPVIDGDRKGLEGMANYQNYDAHFVPVGKGFQPVASLADHNYTEFVVFDQSQCLPSYRVELRDASIPASVQGSNSVFVDGMDQAVKFCYIRYLSLPYTLTSIMWDWDYCGIPRPNHGLAHTVRTMTYVPFVVEALAKKVALPQSWPADAVRLLQLGMLFFVAGRENEAGSREDSVAYKRFREKSKAAFLDFMKSDEVCFLCFFSFEFFDQSICFPLSRTLLSRRLRILSSCVSLTRQTLLDSCCVSLTTSIVCVVSLLKFMT